MNAEDVKIYLSIGGPSILMLMAEWLSLEIVILMAASISMGAVGAMTVSYTYFNLIWAFPFGFQAAITATVGNHIGAGNEKAAKVTAAMGLVYCTLFTCLFTFFTRNYAE